MAPPLTLTPRRDGEVAQLPARRAHGWLGVPIVGVMTLLLAAGVGVAMTAAAFPAPVGNVLVPCAVLYGAVRLLMRSEDAIAWALDQWLPPTVVDMDDRGFAVDGRRVLWSDVVAVAAGKGGLSLTYHRGEELLGLPQHSPEQLSLLAEQLQGWQARSRPGSPDDLPPELQGLRARAAGLEGHHRA